METEKELVAQVEEWLPELVQEIRDGEIYWAALTARLIAGTLERVLEIQSSR